MNWDRWDKGSLQGLPQKPQIDPQKVIADVYKKRRELILGLSTLVLFFLGTTSFYTIQPDERAVVLRFGHYIGTAMPGLNFKLPFGIDRQLKVSTRVEQENFGFRTPTSASASMGLATYERSMDMNALAEEALMLTGDLKVAEVKWSVQYQIADPKKFLFGSSNPRKTIRDISVATMRQVVGDRDVYEVLTVGRERIAGEAREISQRVLDEKYDMGVQLVAVNLQSVSPPGPVAPSFNDVNAAIQDKDQLVNRAEAEYNKIIPEARGRAEQEILASQGYAIEAVNRARGDADRLTKVIAEYEKAPEATRTRLYLEMAEATFSRMGSVTIIDPALRGVVPVFTDKKVPLDAVYNDSIKPRSADSR